MNRVLAGHPDHPPLRDFRAALLIYWNEKGNGRGARRFLLARHLYEKENYSIAQSYIEIALRKFADKKKFLAYASAINLRGSVNLDICLPAAALKSFKEAYELRTSIFPNNNNDDNDDDDDTFLAANQVNIVALH
ncbi:hypothetical protein BDW59DRAFT_156165 [Aspergillus cavernicola]|uniref:Uncharacterized protein n=1 Tax=Aspergillus cavernicola TaxID=176166 RepID=A0ABR4J5C8_9EURO